MKRDEATILVVDDYEDSRAMYAEYLGRAGFKVLEAADGREAIDMTRTHLPDLVVMDLSLPLVDGWTATRELKADASTRGVRILALTGHALSGHSVGGSGDAGWDAFLTKPCLPRALVEAVEKLLATPLAGAPDAKAAPAAPSAPASSSRTPPSSKGAAPPSSRSAAKKASRSKVPARGAKS